MSEELSVEELVERYQAGASLDDLAILCGCSSGRIRRILTAVRIEIRPRGVEPTPETPHPAPTPPRRRAGRLSDQAAHDLLRTGELAGRYQAGASLEDLAIEYRCSPSKIRCLLFRAGVAIRSPGHKPAIPARRDGGTAAASLPVEDLAARYRAGATLIELAVLCACSSTTVRALLIAAGVEMRPLGRPITRRAKR